MKKIAAILLSICLLLPFASGLASGASYLVATVLDWTGETYDIIEGRFKCVDQVPCTYYAMHNWFNGDGSYANTDEGSGYAGFQYTADGRTITIMSVWNTSRGHAEIVYAPEGSIAQPFSGEGEGIQILAPYDWRVGVWYTMRIQAVTVNGKTYYEQWVKPENGSWTHMATISYSTPGLGFKWDCFFLEDWAGNGLMRSCQLREYYARRASDGQWISLTDYQVSCDDRLALAYSAVLTDASTVYMQSGGNRIGTREVPFTLTVLQGSRPDWSPLLGH